MPRTAPFKTFNLAVLPRAAIFVSVLGGALAIVALIIGTPIQPGQGTVLGGIGVLIGGSLAYWSSHQKRLSDEAIAHAANAVAHEQLEQAKTASREAMQHSNRLVDEQLAARQEVHQREIVRDLRSRFAQAAEQLSSVQPVIRLAGVYAMVSLADDWLQTEPPNPLERQVCVDVLRAYLRSGVDERATVIDDDGKLLPLAADTEVRQTIFRIIADRRHMPSRNRASWVAVDTGLARADLRLIDFGTSKFRDLNLEGAKFTKSKLYNSSFIDCNLVKVDFSYSTMQKLTFERCDLSHADFSNIGGIGASVDFSGSKLISARMAGVYLSGTNFSLANLGNANFRNSGFWNANFQQADLQYIDMEKCKVGRSNFKGANFSWANLEKADLSSCDLAGACLDDIWYTEETKWPEHFIPPPSRADSAPF